MTEKNTLLSLKVIEDLTFKALTYAGVTEANAGYLAKATAITEAQGVSSHGLAYIPIYIEHVKCGKVDPEAVPTISHPFESAIKVDARNGFAHPAIELGFKELIPTVKGQGIGILNITRSYNCGVLGVHTRALAEENLIGIGFTNAPASIAPSGGSRPVVGTNPFSLAVPDREGEFGFLIDQSASVVSKSEILKYLREEKSIPVGWGLDSEGRSTTDPSEAITGSMAPAGAYKGVNIAIMVELFAAVLSGANLGKESSPFSGAKGGPPGTGQCFIAINPEISGKNVFQNRIETLLQYLSAEENSRVPGHNRMKNASIASSKGVLVDNLVLSKVRELLP